jgi:hypothetical protein
MEVKPEVQAVAGSPLWQAVFISFAVVFILFEVVRGWRLGLIGQLVRIAALVVLSLIGGAVLALLVYALVTSIGMVLIKRIGQQNSEPVHLIYGIAGAIVGLIFGAFVLWLIVAGVRAIGAVADAEVRSQENSHKGGQSATSPAPDVRGRFLSDPNAGSTALATSLARLKNSLELGPLGNAVKQTGPVSLKTIETLGKVGSVFSSQERTKRFLTFPGAVS